MRHIVQILTSGKSVHHRSAQIEGIIIGVFSELTNEGNER